MSWLGPSRSRVAGSRGGLIRFGQSEGLRQSSRLAPAWPVVDVAGGCARVGVAHPVLEFPHAFGLRDCERPEGVAEVVEADRVELRPLLRGAVAAAEG